jgi:mannose-6-phosphate isomerase-like protein (cupin superfamily)
MAALAMWAIWVLAYIIGMSSGTRFAAYNHATGHGLCAAADQQLAVAIMWAVPALCFPPVIYGSLITSSTCARSHAQHDQLTRVALPPALAARRESRHPAQAQGDHVSMTDFLAGYVVPPGAGVSGDPGLKASQHSTGGTLSVFETTIEAGPPLHVHDQEDECLCVLAGELSVRCGSDTFDAPAGSFVFLPRGRPHRFRAKDQPAKLLLITVPGGIEDYFHQINNATTDEQRDRIGEQHSIRVVPE